MYVDNILVFLNSFEQHIHHLHQIFSRLENAGLTLKPSKCSFTLQKVHYLGHVITKDGVQVDVTKTDAVKSFPTPKCTKDVRSFLGLCNYYRKFIKNYSTIISPLTSLLRKEINFEWSVDCQYAFDQLKIALTSPPVLAYPDNSKTFTLTTDASCTVLGFVLGQFDDKGKERVIAFGGRSLNKFERNYSISERECLLSLRVYNRIMFILLINLSLFSRITLLSNGFNLSNMTQVAWLDGLFFSKGKNLRSSPKMVNRMMLQMPFPDALIQNTQKMPLTQRILFQVQLLRH